MTLPHSLTLDDDGDLYLDGRLLGRADDPAVSYMIPASSLDEWERLTLEWHERVQDGRNMRADSERSYWADRFRHVEP
jgi:hypothetical protein